MSWQLIKEAMNDPSVKLRSVTWLKNCYMFFDGNDWRDESNEIFNPSLHPWELELYTAPTPKCEKCGDVGWVTRSNEVATWSGKCDCQKSAEKLQCGICNDKGMFEVFSEDRRYVMFEKCACKHPKLEKPAEKKTKTMTEPKTSCKNCEKCGLIKSGAIPMNVPHYEICNCKPKTRTMWQPFFKASDGVYILANVLHEKIPISSAKVSGHIKHEVEILNYKKELMR